LLRDIVLAPGDTEASEFTVSYWKVDPGEHVSRGDEIVVLESTEDKTALAVVSPYTGTLIEILVSEDEAVAPGTNLGRMEVE
jgi:pyruvate/2-oxoglutarate dehydrogenase complex dihydrolipoamide acyltransferase (E2) component